MSHIHSIAWLLSLPLLIYITYLVCWTAVKIMEKKWAGESPKPE
jgi:hypothetical protein